MYFSALRSSPILQHDRPIVAAFLGLFFSHDSNCDPARINMPNQILAALSRRKLTKDYFVRAGMPQPPGFSVRRLALGT